MFPPAEWTPSSSIGSADQIQFHIDTGYDVYFNFPGGRWVTASAGAGVSQNSKIIPPGTAVFVSHANPAQINIQLQTGEARYNDFIRPARKGVSGLNFVTPGYPLDASPAGLLMGSGNGFVAAASTGSASQIQTWKADTVPGGTGYYLSWLISGNVWRQTSPAVTTTNTPLFRRGRGAFVLVRQDNPGWTHPQPWDSSLWQQPPP